MKDSPAKIGVIFLLFFYSLLFPSYINAAPIISNISTSSLAEHGEAFGGTDQSVVGFAANATVNWETNEPATSKVIYGTSSSTLTNSSRTDSLLTLKHSLRLENNIYSGGTYFYKVISRNANGEETQSTVGSITMPINSQWWEVGHDSWMKRFGLSDWTADTDWIGNGNIYRKTITKTSSPTGGWISIEQFPFKGPGLRLLVNGRQVGTWSYGYSVPSFDISPYLTTGTNTIIVGQELGSGFTFQFLAEGEISYADGTVELLNSSPSNWQTATTPSSDWSNYTGNWSASSIVFNTPFGSPYQRWLISGLPAGTPRRGVEKHYSTNLARRNRLRESEIPELTQSRTYLSTDSIDKNLAISTATLAEEDLAALESLFNQAEPQIASTNYISAQSTLTLTDSILSQAELKVDVAKMFLDSVSAFTSLILANNEFNNGQVSSSLNSLSNDLNSVRNDIRNNLFNQASSKLTSFSTSLSTLKNSLENSSGYHISKLNNSDNNAFGFLRMRKANIYLNQYQQITTGNWIGLKSDVNFAKVPSDWKSEFRESLNFLSPFTLINVSGNSYNFGSTASHIAFKLINGIQVKPISTNVYNAATDGQLTANWLLVWNTTTPNTTYLVILQNKPDQITYGAGDITISRTGGVGDLVVYELYADGASINGSTSNITNWPSTLANDTESAVIQDIGFWSKALLKIPLNYVELQKDSATTSEVIIKYRYYAISDAWNTTPISISPLPPVLSFARCTNYPTLPCNSYPGVGISGTVINTKYNTRSGNFSTWGPYEFTQADSLRFSYPNMRGTDYMQGVNTSVNGNVAVDEAAALGFNGIRGGVNTSDILVGRVDNNFDLKSDFAAKLVPGIDYANSKGLRVVLVIWSAVRDPAVLENNSANQTKFVDAWKQIAQTLAGKQVVYDLINEPSFTTVANYNSLMDRTVQAIRSVDSTNPITIEGFNTFSRNFSGMTRPNYSNIWFQHHPYPAMYDQAYNTIDQYYPGYTSGSTYADSDTYFEDNWQGLVRSKLQDPALGLMNGEFGIQSAPQGTKAALARDIADINRRYGIHHTYFTLTGWTMFDLYSGSGATKDVQTDVVNALLGKQSNTQPTLTPTPSPVPATRKQLLQNWLNATFDQNADGKVNSVDFTQIP